MITMKKSPERDFIILNLTDPQMRNEEWEEGHEHRRIFTDTVTELVDRVHPDLITLSGDVADAGQYAAYEALADFMDRFAIPWAPIWGNHDNQYGPEAVERVVEGYENHPYFLYERGDAALGNGNYVIRIEEEGKIIEGLILMDTHHTISYTNAEGKNCRALDKLWPEQLSWYERQIRALADEGCTDTTLIIHIPIYAYRLASQAVFRDDINIRQAPLEMFLSGECQREAYPESVGVQFDAVNTPMADDGVMDVITRLHSTKTIIAGHDHKNTWMIPYQGVRLAYGLKTGAGCYYDPRLNGGTVIRVTSDGVAEVSHEFVDMTPAGEQG